MERIVVDGSLASQLAGKTGRAELVDAAGRVLGTFAPESSDNGYESIGYEPTAEEMEEMSRNCKRWYTADEVMARLRSIG